MLNRDILEEQELEYALSLIKDMERESNDTKMDESNRTGVTDRKENQDVCCRQEEEQRENPVDEEEEQNPSPWTLREMRRAFFEGQESRRRMASDPGLTRSVQTEREPDCADPVDQTEPPRRRLRSGRSY